MSRHEAIAMFLALASAPVLLLAIFGITWAPLAAWIGAWIVLFATKEPRHG